MIHFVHLVMQQEFSQRLMAPAPAPGTVIPARAPPNFHELYQFLMMGRIMQLTSLPDSLAQACNPGPLAGAVLPGNQPNGRHLEDRQPPPAGDPDRLRGGGTGGGNQQRTQVENRHQNPQLKSAWAALGHSSIFGVGSPFRDETQRNNKKVIMRPGSNSHQRICLAMALKGICYSNCGGFHGCLSAEEVRLVAQAGGLQVPGI